jgi:hypothetical protein
VRKSQLPLKRRDAAGHLDPEYARDLLEMARESRNDDNSPESSRAFITGSRTQDSLANEFGEAFVEAATSGEGSNRRHRVTPDEHGGPFLYTSAREEFALDDDELGITDAPPELMRSSWRERS